MSFSIDVAAIQRMALVKVDGGLGSQMWQYALSLAVGKGSSFTVKHDLSWFRHYAKDIRGVENRFFILNSVFTNINLRLPSENERLFFHIALNRYPDSICNFDPDILALKQPTYLGGYYVNAQYVTSAEKEIREA